MSIFDAMYAPGGTGSGVGSGVAYTAGYRAFLERFMREHDIRSVLDVGCGDWQFSRLVDWGDRLYVGVDECGPLIDRLNAEHGARQRYFLWYPPKTPFDLVIVKDVMIHLPNAEVLALIGKLQRQRHKHLLLVNDIATPNVDIERGHYRALDITAPPFGVKAEIVYTFPRLNNETKVVHHVCSP